MKTVRRKFGNAGTGTAVYSLAEIGRACGVSLQSIQAVEQRALRKIKLAIQKEAEVAGVSIQEWLFGDASATSSDAERVLQQLIRSLES
jgi:Fe-S cluster assembly ATPase SufC